MALRDKLAANMAGFLEPGEQIRHVFVAQRGNPAWSLLSYWILLAPLALALGVGGAVLLAGSSSEPPSD